MKQLHFLLLGWTFQKAADFRYTVGAVAALLPRLTPSVEVVFRARGLTKIYRLGDVEVLALRSVDLDLYRSEFVVLLGHSGSGKSTRFSTAIGNGCESLASHCHLNTSAARTFSPTTNGSAFSG